jgi:hypothetical protein
VNTHISTGTQRSVPVSAFRRLVRQDTNGALLIASASALTNQQRVRLTNSGTSTVAAARPAWCKSAKQTSTSILTFASANAFRSAVTLASTGIKTVVHALAVALSRMFHVRPLRSSTTKSASAPAPCLFRFAILYSRSSTLPPALAK